MLKFSCLPGTPGFRFSRGNRFHSLPARPLGAVAVEPAGEGNQPHHTGSSGTRGQYYGDRLDHQATGRTSFLERPHATRTASIRSRGRSPVHQTEVSLAKEI